LVNHKYGLVITATANGTKTYADILVEISNQIPLNLKYTRYINAKLVINNNLVLHASAAYFDNAGLIISFFMCHVPIAGSQMYFVRMITFNSPANLWLLGNPGTVTQEDNIMNTIPNAGTTFTLYL
jgi:hypothetical protein